MEKWPLERVLCRPAAPRQVGVLPARSGAAVGPGAVGVQGLCCHGSRELTAGLVPLVLQPQLCLVCLESTRSPCDLCPPRSGGVLLKKRGHQSPCLAEWVPRKVKESRAIWAKSSPLYQCPPYPARPPLIRRTPSPPGQPRAYPHHALDIPSCLGERAYSWDSASFGSS